MKRNLIITFSLSRKRATLLARRMWLDTTESEDPEVRAMAKVVTKALRKLGVTADAADERRKALIKLYRKRGLTPQADKWRVSAEINALHKLGV